MNRAAFVLFALLSGCHWQLEPVRDSGVTIEDAGFDALGAVDAAPGDVRDATDIGLDVADIVDVVIPPDEPTCLPTTSMTAMRFANLAPLSRTMDYCLRRSDEPGAAFAGPILRNYRFGADAGAEAGVTLGVDYPQLTGYVPLLPGRYTLRIVAGGSMNCDTGLPGTVDSDLVPMRDSYYTVMVSGLEGIDAGEPLTVRSFRDTHDLCLTCNTRIRMIHAAPASPCIELQAVILGSPTPIVRPTAYLGLGESATAERAGCNGYYTAMVSVPNYSVQVEVRTGGSGDSGVCPALASPGRLFDFPFALDAGMLQTGFLIGRFGATGTDRLSVLLCNDISAPAPLTQCQLFR